MRLPKSLLNTAGIQAYNAMIPVSNNGLKCNLSWQWCGSEEDINCKGSDQNIIQTQITKKKTYARLAKTRVTTRHEQQNWNTSASGAVKRTIEEMVSLAP